LLTASSLRAQSAEAEALFTEGDTLMKQGKVAEACEAFEASNRIEPRAGTLIRLGECREQNHQLASA
jgi:cytochrome c-type biogenesis protein CcmH/NrfG